MVEGLNITGIRNINGKLLLIQFKDCTITYNDEVLFKPKDGIFDLVVGSEIVSAFAGSADFRSFHNLYHTPETRTIQAEKTQERLALERLYQNTREYREHKTASFSKIEILDSLEKNHPQDWLLSLELYEISYFDNDASFCESIILHLEKVKKLRPEIKHLVDDGLARLKK